MPTCTHCHQPQTAALVICPACLAELQGKHPAPTETATALRELAAAREQLSLAENFIHYVGPDAMEAYRLFSTTPEPDNKALTAEELRGMDGEPVWVTPTGFWALVDVCEADVTLTCQEGERAYAAKWIELMGAIYRRPPEKE